MLTHEDFDILAGAATARLLSVMTQTAQETSPVDTVDGLDARIRDLLMDLRGVLDGPPDGILTALVDDDRVFHLYCNNAEGDYDHPAVALAVQRMFSDLNPVFEGLDASAPEAVRDWLDAYGDREHSIAWLAQRIADLLVADASQFAEAAKRH